ncbi:MAG TPA: glycosyltransferase family 39 protein [Vicinamibacterales bacterium]|nr:glycosyltransferase family 39 protein [Vicinamibacterales bacterium]
MRRAEVVAAATLAMASIAAVWAAPRPVPEPLALAVSLVWGSLFVYVPLRAASWWAWREVVRAAPQPEDRRAFGLVLLLAFGLLIWGLDWGLTESSWAADELRPDWVRDVLRQGLRSGWFDKYPWLHYAVLSIPVSAFELADRLGMLPVGSVASWAGQLALMRAVSVMMALGTLVGSYLCGVEMVGPRRAIFAPLALLLTPLFLYYGKMANLDMPALCWFSWAMVAFLRIRRAGRLGDYVWLGIASAGAVATKDQVYANLALVGAAVIVMTARQHGGSASWGGLGRALADRRVWAAGAAAVLASIVFHNMVFNVAGFAAHIRLLSTLGDLAIVPRTLAGYLELLGLTLSLFRWALGWPLFLLSAAGIAGALVRGERRWWLWLLVVPLSFHVSFTWVTLYVNDRYLFGGIFVLALFAGAACADAFDAVRWRITPRLLVAASFVHALLYAASINVMMNLDTRHAVGSWVSASADARAVVGLVGGRTYMPRIAPPAQVTTVEPTVEAVRQASPDVLVLNARFARRFEQARAPEGRALLRALEDGSLGYDEVLRYRSPVPSWALLQYEEPFQGSGESPLTNLDKVNPEIVVYRRRGA